MAVLFTVESIDTVPIFSSPKPGPGFFAFFMSNVIGAALTDCNSMVMVNTIAVIIPKKDNVF